MKKTVKRKKPKTTEQRVKDLEDKVFRQGLELIRIKERIDYLATIGVVDGKN